MPCRTKDVAKCRKKRKTGKKDGAELIFTGKAVYFYGKKIPNRKEPVMKKQLLVLGCAALAAFGAACSSDPALKSAVITPME